MSDSIKKIRTRFAPSPTGFLHVGGLRTALYSYLFAKHNGGEFLLRIEDTDQTRKVDGAIEYLINILDQFGLHRDQDKPVVQSERLNIYQKYADELITSGHAYRCFCTKERLDQVRQQQTEHQLPPMYDGHCRDLATDEVAKLQAAGTASVIRLKVPRVGITAFNDLIRGNVQFDNKLIDDQVLIKSDGFPTYHLAVVIDDHDMEISHVIRGEEWLSSTPKHVILYQAFGWPLPEFAHLPLLLNPDKTKLSKRQGDVAVGDYLAKGYLIEALLNFVLLLGWNPKTEQEIFNLTDMVVTFDITKINKSGAVFDMQKLDWLNAWYIRQLPLERLAILCQPFLTAAGITGEPQKIIAALATQQQRMRLLAEAPELLGFFFTLPEYSAELLIWKKSDAAQTKVDLEKLITKLTDIPGTDFTQANLEALIMTWLTEQGIETGDLLWPMRVALSGLKASPGPFELAGALGKEETIKRLEDAIKKL